MPVGPPKDRRSLRAAQGDLECPAVHHVRVEAPLYRRHHHRKGKRFYVARNGGSCSPRGIVVAHPVEKVERLLSSLRNGAFFSGGADRFGKDHRHGGRHLQRMGEEVAAQQRHDALLTFGSYPPGL